MSLTRLAVLGCAYSATTSKIEDGSFTSLRGKPDTQPIQSKPSNNSVSPG